MIINAKKSLGQNWLINPHILDKIISTAEISRNDTVLEVGPGTGLLTKKLAERAKRVVAVEKDHRLIPQILQLASQHKKVEIIEDDILEFDPTSYKLQVTGYKIVANIPYYITSHFLRVVFEEWPRPELIVLTIQKEVAQRIMAKPPHMNLLALSVQYYSEPEVVGYISKNNFRPIPRVDSAIIRLSVKVKMQNGEETKRLFELIRTGFSEKRKQLAPTLSKKVGIEKDKLIAIFKKFEIIETARAENLSLKQWELLAQSLATQKS